METTEKQISLDQLPIGARLLVRCKKDWRVAVVSKFLDEKATLIIGSPSGRNYRLRLSLDSKIRFDGEIPVLIIRSNENWRENFSNYDLRW